MDSGLAGQTGSTKTNHFHIYCLFYAKTSHQLWQEPLPPRHFLTSVWHFRHTLTRNNVIYPPTMLAFPTHYFGNSGPPFCCCCLFGWLVLSEGVGGRTRRYLCETQDRVKWFGFNHTGKRKMRCLDIYKHKQGGNR